MKKTLIIILLGWFVINPIKVSIAEAPDRKVQDYSIKELVSHYSSQFQVSQTKMLRVMNCESGGSMNPPGSNDGGRAKGLYQYHQPTWDAFSKEFGKQLDRNSAHDQVMLTAWAFSKGYDYHWTCK